MKIYILFLKHSNLCIFVESAHIKIYFRKIPYLRRYFFVLYLLNPSLFEDKKWSNNNLRYGKHFKLVSKNHLKN